MKIIVYAFLIYGFLIQPALSQQIQKVPDDFLNSISDAHPYLLLNDAELNALKNQQKSDPILEKSIADVLLQAGKDIGLAPLEHKLVGPRLLSVSRECLRRVYSLGLAYRITGDEKYARVCEMNLHTVCSFPDWNPSHFLDTAEMSHAVGIGYDWLYKWLTSESRATIRNGLIRHGLEPGVKAYKAEEGIPRWWIESYHNWNQVCNSGLIVGALAIADSDPDYARIVIPGAVQSLPRALATYGPDGAWPEGPGYWHYASRYTAYGLAALTSALGKDYGLSEMTGLSVTGFFPVHTTGPTGLYVNFADSGERARRRTMPCLFWFARRYNEQFIADKEHEMIARHGARPEHVVWYVPKSKETYNPILDTLFKGSVEVTVMRSAWNDPDALFVGFKAGYNQVNHGHLDLGNFELDALGVRWARDLGSDNYNLPDYWGRSKDATRWTYYRLNSFSHNVCTLDNQSQDVMAEASFVKFHTEEENAHAVVDLTSAYSPKSVKSSRGIALIGNRRAVLVQDEFELADTADIAWGMTTDADIDIVSGTARLTQNGKTLSARILSPAGAAFSVESAEQEPPQKRNTGVKRLVIRLKERSGSVRVSVLLSPHWEDTKIISEAEIQSLDAWK